jgi:hypothetical protein
MYISSSLKHSMILVKEVPIVEISSWRDIILIIWGLVTTVVVVFIAVILFLFYRKIISLLESTDLMVAKVNDIVNYVDTEFIRPVNRFDLMIKGIIQGISIFSSIFKKKEDRDE